MADTQQNRAVPCHIGEGRCILLLELFDKPLRQEEEGVACQESCQAQSAILTGRLSGWP
jgi:hypothetical protein